MVNDMKDSFGEQSNPFLEVEENFRPYSDSEINPLKKLKRHEIPCSFLELLSYIGEQISGQKCQGKTFFGVESVSHPFNSFLA